MFKRTTLLAGACALVFLPSIALAQGNGAATPPGELGISLNDLRLISVDTPSGSEEGVALDASLLVTNRDLPVSLRLDVDLMKAGDLEVGDVEARLFHGGETWAIGAMAGLRDVGSAPNTATYGVEADRYWDGFTVSGGAYLQQPADGGGPNANRLEAGLTVYPTDNLSLRGRLAHVEPDGTTAAYEGYGVEVETRLGDNGSLFVSWDSSDDTDTDVIGIGFRFGGPTGSLQERDRDRTGSGPDRLFRSPF